MMLQSHVIGLQTSNDALLFTVH